MFIFGVIKNILGLSRGSNLSVARFYGLKDTETGVATAPFDGHRLCERNTSGGGEP